MKPLNGSMMIFPGRYGSGAVRRLGLRYPDLEWRLLNRIPVSLLFGAGSLPGLRSAAALGLETVGALERAAELYDGRRPAGAYARRLAEAARAAKTGTLPLAASAVRHSLASGDAVVMALYGSEPWLQNGYSVRSRAVLDQLAARGIACVPVTRPNFPHDLGAFRTAPRNAEESAHGHRYRRLTSSTALWGGPLSDYIEVFAEQLAEIAIASGARIIHAASNHVCGLAAALAAERIGARSVYEIRGLWHRSTASRRPGWEDTETFALHEALERFAAERADAVVVLSQALAQHVQAWGIAARKIAVVPNGVDSARFAPRQRPAALRRILEGEQNRLLVGYVGTLTPYEGIDSLIEAAALLERQGIGVTLALVGGGEERSRLAALAARRRVRVSFVDRVSWEEVADYYATFDVCAFPRPTGGPADLVPPLKLAEALACGVPTIVGNRPPLCELVTNEATGLVADGADALAAALARLGREPQFARSIGAAGRARVLTDRTWQHAGDALAALYEQLRES
jgi:glycosyltransferase involved in cell wall biosynthesis